MEIHPDDSKQCFASFRAISRSRSCGTTGRSVPELPASTSRDRCCKIARTSPGRCQVGVRACLSGRNKLPMQKSLRKHDAEARPSSSHAHLRADETRSLYLSRKDLEAKDKVWRRETRTSARRVVDLCSYPSSSTTRVAKSRMSHPRVPSSPRRSLDRSSARCSRRHGEQDTHAWAIAVA